MTPMHDKIYPLSGYYCADLGQQSSEIYLPDSSFHYFMHIYIDVSININNLIWFFNRVVNRYNIFFLVLYLPRRTIWSSPIIDIWELSHKNHYNSSSPWVTSSFPTNFYQIWREKINSGRYGLRFFWVSTTLIHLKLDLSLNNFL